MTRTLLFFIVGILSFSYTVAQNSASQNSFGEDFSKVWHRHKMYTIRMVEAMPEKYFEFKPTPEIRSFSELVAHIVQTNYGFASMTTGEEVEPALMNLKGKTKKEMIDVLSKSFDYGNLAAKNITNKQLTETRPWGNPLEQDTKRTKKEIFHILREHAAHARGAMTIYLRLKEIKPPQYID